MIPIENMMLWNGLPALVLDKDNKIVVFSNVNGNFVLCELPYDMRNDNELIAEVRRQGFFDCLDNNKEYLSDELTVVLSLSEKCNCRCKYCFLDAEAQGEAMSEELLYASINKAFEIANGRDINFSAFGGEPTTEAELIEKLLEFTKGKYPKEKLHYSITTKGVFSENTCKLLIDNNFSISLSMDGIPEVQNYQRPLANSKPSYSLVEQNIKRLVDAENKMKIRCTVTKYSVNRMVDAVKWLHDLGVKRIHFEPVMPGGRGCNNDESLQPPSAKKFVANLIEAIELGGIYGMDIICFPYMNMMIAPIVFCDGRAENRLVISPRGIISSCVEVQTKNHELFPYLGLGEYDTNSKSLIFLHDSRRDSIRGCHALSETKQVCKACALKFFCGGGCPTRNFRGTGSTDVVDQYRCDIIRLIMPYILNKFYTKTTGGITNGED